MSEPQSPADLPDSSNPPRRRWLRVLGWLAVVIIVLVVAGELVARFYFGLGDPPLSVFDPDMEYRFKPSQTVHRFGNLIHYNAYSQRGEDYPQHKTNPDQLRVLMVGDSVLNGGSLTDQYNVISSILQRKLREALHRDVLVANASAGSWGPPNELAYVKKYGFFDADVVVLVLNDADAFDAMTFEPLVGKSPEFPDRKPLLALSEAITRYLPRYLPHSNAPPPPSTHPTPSIEQSEKVCLDAIRDFVRLARDHGIIVLLAEQHNRTDEPGTVDGRHKMEAVAQEMHVPMIEWDQQMRQSMAQGKDPYRPNDDVHPDDVGNYIIADALFQPIEDALMRSTKGPTTAPASAK